MITDEFSDSETHVVRRALIVFISQKWPKQQKYRIRKIYENKDIIIILLFLIELEFELNAHNNL